MATIQRFEDILAWQKAREPTRQIYDATRQGGWNRDFAPRDQIRAAAISVMSKIAEGFGRGGDKEFIQFPAIARGSIAEIQARLHIALDQGSITGKSFRGLYVLADEAARLSAGMMGYLQQSPLCGRKFASRRTSAQPPDAGPRIPD